MPVISRFSGIIIKMYFQQAEHNPPHIHVFYNEEAASVDIKTGEVNDGDLSPKTISLVRQWLEVNRDKLLEMWVSQEFKTLPPL